MLRKMIFAVAVVLALAGIAVSNVSAAPPAAAAGDLRVALDSLLTEHVVLATSATRAALGGRSDEFQAAADALDTNSVDVSKAIGSVYGADAEKAFLPLWRKHIGFVVDYTTGLAAKDQAKADQAVQDLLAYATEFAAFLNTANPNIPKDAGADYVKDHILTLKAVIDDQAAGDVSKEFTDLRMAYMHMDGLAVVLAGAIAKQMPDKFEGAADSPAANLRSTLTMALQEHVALAAAATNAALGGRDKEFQAAAAALDANSVDFSKAVGSVYGADAEKAFLPLWRKHIGFFVDYTTGVATKDQAKADKAVNDLVAYAQELSDFLTTANPNLPQDVLGDYIKDHILTLKAVVDAQAAKDYAQEYTALRMAFGHMTGLSYPLTDAIVKQFPDKFGAAPAAAAEPHTMPTAGMDHTHAGDNLFVVMGIAALVTLGGLVILRRASRA